LFVLCSRQKFQCQVQKKSVLYVVISTDRVDATNASVVDSSQPSIEGNSATACALVSPPVENSAHASEESHEDVVCTLFVGNEDINVNDISSQHICLLT
jgi:hypothetical protein